MKDHISTAPWADQTIRGIPLNQLVLAPENVRRTSADDIDAKEYRPPRIRRVPPEESTNSQRASLKKYTDCVKTRRQPGGGW